MQFCALNNRTIILIGCLLSLHFLPAWAQNEQSTKTTINTSSHSVSNLSNIVLDALENDPIYRSTKFKLQGDLEVLPQARSYLLPELSASVRGSYTNESLTAPDLPFSVQGDASYNTHFYGLQLRQVIYNRELFSQVKRANLESEIANAGLQIAHQDLILRAVKSYLEVLRANQNLSLTNANLESSEGQYRLIESLFDVGQANQAEYQQALARWKTAIAANINAQNNARNIERELESITGTHYSNLASVQPDTDVSILLADIDRDSWIERIEQNNLSLYQQQLTVEVANRSVREAKSNYYPTLEAVINYGNLIDDGSIAGPGFRRKTTDASLLLSVPLYSGGRNRSRVRSVSAGLESAQQDLLNIRQQVIRDGEFLLDKILNQTQILSALAGAVEATQLALEAKQLGFEVGIETNLNVLDAQQDFFQASLEHNLARYDTMILSLELEQAAGVLNSDHLIPLNALLAQ